MTEQSIPVVLRRAASRTLRVRLGKEQAGRDYSTLIALAARWPEIKAAIQVAEICRLAHVVPQAEVARYEGLRAARLAKEAEHA